MYADSIRKCFADGDPTYPVGQIEAAMRLASSNGCLDAISPRKFVREVFAACTLIAELGPDDARELAWSFGIDKS